MDIVSNMESSNDPTYLDEKDHQAESNGQDKLSSNHELVKQWRLNLESIKNDISFELPSEPDNTNESLLAALEALEYLDKKNTLLDENEDFQFTDDGFEAYKAKYHVAFEYLSGLEKFNPNKSPAKFYFFSRTKQLEQRLKMSSWMHSLFHLLMLLIIILTLGGISLLILQKTQGNLFVKLLLGWFWIESIKSSAHLVSKYKQVASTPFRFSVSLLGIHSVNILLKVITLWVIPFVFILSYNKYWIDDFIIIGLFLSCVINFKLDDEPTEELNKQEITRVESANV